VIRARNVLGYIEGKDPSEAIVIGGHYDHVGKYSGFTYNGADDNASGTTGMLSLARAIHESGRKPAKTIVFAAWTGREGIPVISLFTGLHKDYHMPNDEIEFIYLEKMVKIIKLTYLGLNEIL
jgi:hypothetical protein